MFIEPNITDRQKLQRSETGTEDCSETFRSSGARNFTNLVDSGFNSEVQPVFKINNDPGLMRATRSAPNAEPRAVASGCYGQQ